mmetsp:Transcript_41550/g.96994  ORF Transcript_41550/g.96994 Transcript_41550/m.96994 type:complete len:116 (+) Transcript_41550:410-757(+)
MLKSIEEAYDAKRVCFLCDPFKCEICFKVLDPSLIGADDNGNRPFPAGCTTSYFELDSTTVKSPSIESNKRPSFQILSFHAKLSVQSALHRGWITQQQSDKLQSTIKVSSPPKKE